MNRVSTIAYFCSMYLLLGNTALLQAIHLGGVDVPKERFIVYIMIGHSNMSGRVKSLDTMEHPRLWNYFIKDCCQKLPHHTWIPARDCIHKDFGGCGRGPTMHFLKKMAAAFPDYYFGVVQNAHSGVSCRENYLKDNTSGDLDLYSEMVRALDTIKGDVTFGAIICMLGIPEAVQSPDSVGTGFSSDIALMVSQFRDTLGLPALPFLIGGFERDGPSIRVRVGTSDTSNWKSIDSQTSALPSVIPCSAVVPSDSLVYFDRWHYTDSSYDIWTQRAVDIIKNHQWYPAGIMSVNGKGAVVKEPSSLKMLTELPIYDALGRKADVPISFFIKHERNSSPRNCSGGVLYSRNKRMLSGLR